MKKLHFALIGAGKMGTRWAGVLAKNKSICLDYIVDSNRDSANHLIGRVMGEDSGCFGTNDLNVVLKDKNIDAVLIVVPHKYHAEITKQALLAGKHVLCEKPGAIYSKEIQKNYRIATYNGLTYMIGYNYRFHDGFIKARQLYEKGAIGRLLFIRARHGFGGRKGYEKEWRINKEIGGGGHLHDQGTHMINMALSFIGKVQRVEGMRADNFWKSGTEDNGFVLLKGKNNVIASIHSSLTQWDRLHSFEMYGTKGYLKIEGLGMRYGIDEHLILGKRTNDPDVVKEKWIDCDAVADHSLERELKEFISYIHKKRNIKLLLSDAYATLQVVEDIYRTNKI